MFNRKSRLILTLVMSIAVILSGVGTFLFHVIPARASTGDVQLCTGTNMANCTTFPVGSYGDISQQGITSPVLSVIVPTDKTLHTYDGLNLSGNRQTLDQDNSDLAGSGYNTNIKSVLIEQKQAPQAVQLSPGNNTTFSAGTTSVDLTFQNGEWFDVHVWGSDSQGNPDMDYDRWKQQLYDTHFTADSLKDGETYAWQVRGADSHMGAGNWSSVWIFSIASSPNPTQTPNPTNTPVSQPTPTQEPTQQPTPVTRTDFITGCTGTNYTGDCDKFGVGQYPGLPKTYVSFWIPCNLTLFVNTGNNFDGNPGVFNNNTPDLSQVWSGNTIHSLKVEPRTDCTPSGSLTPPTQTSANGSLIVCTDAIYNGNCKRYPNGSYPDPQGDGFYKDISSVLMGQGCSFPVNTQKNFQGNTGRYDRSIPDFGAIDNGYWNDNIGSFKVESCSSDPAMPNQGTTQDPPPMSNPTPVSSGDGNHIPVGSWFTWGDSFVKGNTYTFVIKADPSSPGDPPIEVVNVTAMWSGKWHLLCHIPNNRPDLGDYYFCSTNFFVDGSYPPDGKITLSFDVYNVNGDVNYAPNGERTATFFSSNPKPPKTIVLGIQGTDCKYTVLDHGENPQYVVVSLDECSTQDLKDRLGQGERLTSLIGLFVSPFFSAGTIIVAFLYNAWIDNADQRCGHTGIKLFVAMAGGHNTWIYPFAKC